MNQNEKDRNAKNRGVTPPAKAKSKGFYGALYACVGLMLTLAVVIGYRNVMMDEPFGMHDPYAQEGMAVGNSDEQPGSYGYLTPEDRMAQGEIGDPFPGMLPDDADAAMMPVDVPQTVDTTATNAPATTVNPRVNVDVDSPVNATDVPRTNMTPSIFENDKNTLFGEPVNQETTAAPTATDSIVIRGPGDVTSPVGITGTTGTRAFEEGDKMAWPVTGEVVMAYSMDHVIYDKTLDQYRTNDSIAIAAALGTEVRAAASGTVVEVTSSRESGKTVVVDHGNGWQTTYSQLQGNVPVEVGSVVKEGQIVGGVGEPSLYSVLLGSHLEFSVARDGVAVNPKDVLVKE